MYLNRYPSLLTSRATMPAPHTTHVPIYRAFTIYRHVCTQCCSVATTKQEMGIQYMYIPHNHSTYPHLEVINTCMPSLVFACPQCPDIQWWASNRVASSIALLITRLVTEDQMGCIAGTYYSSYIHSSVSRVSPLAWTVHTWQAVRAGDEVNICTRSCLQGKGYIAQTSSG